MSNVLIEKQKIDILANAISDKSGVPVTMTLDEMVEAVDGIETGGGTPALQSKSVSFTPTETAQSQTVTADSGYDGLSSVVASVGAISSAYVGSEVPVLTENDLNASYDEMWISASQYPAIVDKALFKWVPYAESNVTASIDASTGLITATSVISKNSSAPSLSLYSAPIGTLTDTLQLSTQAATTITPSTSQQTAVAAGKYTTGAVTVSAMPSGTAGTPTATKGTVSNHSVSVTPSVTNTTGYITGGTKTGTAVTVTASELVSGNLDISQSGTTNVANYATVSVADGILTQTVTGTVTPTITVSNTGLIEAYGTSYTENVSPVYQSGYIDNSDTLTVVASAGNTYQLDTQAAKTVTPSTSAQTAVAAGKYTTGAVTVAAMPSGTAGTPSATKGTVSNHSVSVTPSVTNTTGYITGGTKTGTAVTVSASELVSGSETKTANGTYDVTNLASLVVAVPIVTYYVSQNAPSSSQGDNGDIWLQTSS